MDNNIQILVSAVDNASATLAGVSSQLSAMGGSASAASEKTAASLGDIRSAALQVGVIAGGAFATLSEEIKSAAGTNEKWNLSLADINNTLKDTGSTIPISKVQDFAAQIEKTTLFSQQQVLSAAQLALGNKSLQGSFENVIGVAADMATHIGTDLPQATQALMKVLNDPSTAVARLANTYNIDLSAAEKKSIETMAKHNDVAGAQAEIMRAVEAQIGGAAKAADNASGTGFAKLANTIEDLQNKVGSALNPVLDKLTTMLIPIIDKIGAWIAQHPQLVAYLLIGAAAVAGLVAGIAALVVIVTSVMIAVSAVGAIIGAIAIGPIAALIAAVGVLAAYMIAHWNEILGGAQIVFEALKSFFTTIWADIKTIWNDAVTWIENLITSWAAKIMSIISGPMNALKMVGNVVGSVGGAILNPGQTIMNAGSALSGILHLASGGVVSSPTLALIGESGPEAVVPLSGGSGSGVGGGNIIINLSGDLYGTDSTAAIRFANQIAKAVNSQLKLRNYS
jgi:hypothetical protein